MTEQNPTFEGAGDVGENPGEAGPPPGDEDKGQRSVPLDLDEGDDKVIHQEPTGPGNELGGGEFPDPDTPPTGPAPGTEP